MEKLTVNESALVEDFVNVALLVVGGHEGTIDHVHQHVAHS